MNILRRISTLRLVIGIAAVAAVSTVAAIAFASEGGPKPPPRPLAQVIRNALSAKPVQGVTARISFTDRLFPGGSLSSSSPLVSGASGRLWASGGRVRLELQSGTGDTEIGFDGHTLVVYDVSSNTVYELPVKHSAPSRTHPDTTAAHRVPSLLDIRHALARIAQRVTLTGAIPGDVAGRPAYSVRVSPSHDGGLLGAVQLAWDAEHGVPLSIAVYSQGDPSPVLALRVTDISFGKVSGSVLNVPLAPGVKVVRVHAPARPAASSTAHHPAVVGEAAVARALSFPLSAPASLVGVPRRTVRLVDWSGTQAALAVYGRGLGAIVVIEQTATAQAHSQIGSLPGVAIRGATGHELATALGTIVQFDRAGVRYTVIGSLPPAAAEAAARAIG